MSATDDINEGGRISATNNGVDDNNSSPAVRITLQVDNTSALPLFLQGRTVAIRGGNLDRYTLDAQEPIQRKQIHENLKHARLLRASLEDAAAKVEALSSSSSSSSSSTSKSAYTKAMNILQSSLPQIHQLEELTQSLEGGGYNNNRFNNKNTVSSKVEVDNDKDQMLREQSIIRQHLLEFVRESNPMAKIDDDKEEHHGLFIGDGMSMIPESNATAIMKKNPVLGRDSIAVVPKRDTISTTSFKRGSSYSSEDRQRKRSKNESINKQLSGVDRVQGGKKSSTKMPAAATATAAATARKDSQGICSSGGSASMTSIIARPPSTTLSHVSNSNTNTTAESAASAPAKKPRPTPAVPKKAPKPRSVKKCHDCKSVTNRHRVCSYWNLKGLTGSKCGKVFCLECLQSKYTVGDDVRGSDDDKSGPSSSKISAGAKSTIEDIMKNPLLDSEWHCPSCLGTCQCNTCVVQRKRDEEREMNRLEGERKSKRRTAAHSSYYNFF